MKTISKLCYVSILLGLTLSSAFGQKEANEDLIPGIFDRYEDKTGVESITISPSLLMTLKSNKTNDKKTLDLVSKISGLRVLNINNSADKDNVREALLAELKTAVKKGYEQIMTIKESGERLELHLRIVTDRNDSKQASALLFITSGNDSVTVLLLSGNIDKSVIDAVVNGEISISKKK
ncbi:hypothetical protein FACS189464_0440 [Bacteroidia bacterium]|nr:hypothetical protein FACS189430_01730 [Bacteroidia bacterium]GHT77906.1 hypothetical protein FACS189464_0440 [Bacteroidia bacterium]